MTIQPFSFFLAQMGVVGQRAKMENKGREISRMPSTFFSDLRINKLPDMNSGVWSPGGVCWEFAKHYLIISLRV